MRESDTITSYRFACRLDNFRSHFRRPSRKYHCPRGREAGKLIRREMLVSYHVSYYCLAAD